MGKRGGIEGKVGERGRGNSGGEEGKAERSRTAPEFQISCDHNEKSLLLGRLRGSLDVEAEVGRNEDLKTGRESLGLSMSEEFQVGPGSAGP